MPKMDAALEAKLLAAPETIVKLIVRVSGDPASYASTLETQGWRVTRQYSLINALAVQGRAGAAARLADEAWVAKIEEDKEVHTM